MSFYPSSRPLALLQSPGPSPGPFINRRDLCVPAAAPLQPGSWGRLSGRRATFRAPRGSRRRSQAPGCNEGGMAWCAWDCGALGLRLLLCSLCLSAAQVSARGAGGTAYFLPSFLLQPTRTTDEVSSGQKSAIFPAHESKGERCWGAGAGHPLAGPLARPSVLFLGTRRKAQA